MKNRTVPGLVSVIIPHFDAPKTIRTAIASVQQQSYPTWELIVVDDCSTSDLDALRELVAEDERLSLISLRTNSGTPAVPRNHGIDAARGEFIAFLDADDVWHPEKLAVQVAFLEERSATLCFSDIFEFTEERAYWELFDRFDLEARPRVRAITHDVLLLKNVVRSGSTVVVRASAVGALRFDPDPAYRAIEDYLFWLTLHQDNVKQSFWLRLPLVGYRLSESSISKSKWFMIRQNYRVYRRYRVGGRGLGIRAYLYFCTYALGSVFALVHRALLRGRVRGLTPKPHLGETR